LIFRHLTPFRVKNQWILPKKPRNGIIFLSFWDCNKTRSESSIYMSDMEIEKIKQQYLEHYDELSPALYRFFVFQTSNSDVASDLLQETFFKTWEYIAEGKVIKNLKAFLYQVARNTLTDYRRKKKMGSLDSLTEIGIDFESETNILEEESMNDDLRYVLENFKIFDEEQKQLILLRYIEGKSIQEIAEIFDERPNTISVKIHRAVEKLRIHIKQ